MEQYKKPIHFKVLKGIVRQVMLIKFNKHIANFSLFLPNLMIVKRNPKLKNRDILMLNLKLEWKALFSNLKI
jgi:hypothetical protein